ncbi:fatty acyl-AMP ligase [Streptomyces sp. NBC_01136]|uniref:fatty acyl-AMP ligase n=1 Tax=Streptomyces sp. NBC_01136 TaxID=2903754 RepID=UPI003865756C|nr:fatty acyl-AMP ligase [Streptomyces sp. NBC_01136]WST81111.1 fatty acyl-AMP ligase [Streptomyces sp. NBC_01136]
MTAAFTTFTELIRERAADLGAADAQVFLRHAGGAEHLSYAALDRRARALAVRLRAYGVQGQPVLLLYPPGPGFLVAFVGCLYAGAIAVPAPLPAGGGERLQRVSGILKDTRSRLVLTDTEHAADTSLWLAVSGRGETVCLATDLDDRDGPGGLDGLAADADAWRAPRTGPDDLAFLQYTSGSTSRPRGVMVTHRNLLANQEALQRLLGTTAADRFSSWLPHYHDMGLIAHVLHPLWLGTVSVQLPPVSFIKRPVSWLRSIGEWGLSVGGGPNFAYDLCTRRVSDEALAGLDLSSWRLALCGAEPVRAKTLDAFARRFAPAGLRAGSLYPGYGLAEATLVVSGGRPGAFARRLAVDAAALEHDELRAPAPGRPARTLVGAGRVHDFDLRIVDPLAGREVPPGHIGEVWLRGDSVAQGYWRQPLETARTFNAALGESGGFLRTGDLGAVDDGELYITGRLKEVIILNGRNLYPQDVEWAIREIGPAFGAGHGAVFTVGAEREQLVVIHEVRAPRAGTERLRALARSVQALVGRSFDVPAGNVILVRPGTLRRTTSGKIQRTLMRTLFLQGELSPLYEVLDPAVQALLPRPAAPGGTPAGSAAGGGAGGTVAGGSMAGGSVAGGSW